MREMKLCALVMCLMLCACSGQSSSSDNDSEDGLHTLVVYQVEDGTVMIKREYIDQSMCTAKASALEKKINKETSTLYVWEFAEEWRYESYERRGGRYDWETNGRTYSFDCKDKDKGGCAQSIAVKCLPSR